MTGLRSGVRRRSVWSILGVARWAAVWHTEGGEVITIQYAKALYYRDTLQWCKAVLREIEELTYCVFISLFYLSALRSSVISWVSHSPKSSIAVLLFSFFSHAQLFPYHPAEWGSWLKQRTSVTLKKLVSVCIWKVEALWLRERDLPLTCYKNMSRRMGDKGFLGRDCQQKWISAGEDTTHSTVQWFTTSWQLFTTTTFQTLLCMTFSLK